MRESTAFCEKSRRSWPPDVLVLLLRMLMWVLVSWTDVPSVDMAIEPLKVLYWMASWLE